MTTAQAPPALNPKDFLGIDRQLSDEERDIRDTVRAFVSDRVVPYVGDWFEEGTIPLELAQELGRIGVLGMHLDGYGCAGTSATAYGLACLELEAGDSGVRSLVSVQGSLAMYAIYRWGSEEQKQDWILHGNKMWITNGSISDVAVVWADTDEGIRGFLVERGTPGFTTQDIERK